MRKRLTAIIAVLLVLTSVIPAQAASMQDPEMVSTFGYEQTRRRVGQTMSWRFLVFDDPEAGVSYSQPLIIPGPNGSTKVILMSGNHLNAYEVPATISESNPIRPLWEPDAINAEKGSSRSHTTYDPQSNLLITGTLHGRLVYHDADTGRRTYYPTNLNSPEGIVSAPLVMHWHGERIVVAGSKNGKAYIVTNFNNSQGPDAFSMKIGGVLTSSPGPLPNNEGFIIGSDVGNKVVVVRFNEILEKDLAGNLQLKNNLHEHKWDDDGRMSGVPASFSIEGPYAYFSDKRGTLYKFDTVNMRPVWTNRDFASSSSFVNRSPALDDKYVYFTFQQNGRIDPKWKGSLVVLDKNTGQIADSEQIPKHTVTVSRIATAPIVTANHVYVGTEDGQLLGWDKKNWFIVERGWYGEGTKEGAGDILKGLASEISVARGLMVFNAGQDLEGTRGTTFVYATGDTNLYVKDLNPGTDDPKPGETYTGTVTFGVDEQRIPDKLAEYSGVTTKADLTINGQQVLLIDEYGNESDILSLMPGIEETLTFAWQAKAEKTEFVARINPERNAFVTFLLEGGTIVERQLEDNEVRTTIEPALPDLYVKAFNPGTNKTDQGQRYTGNITFALKPTYELPVTAKLTLTHNNYPVSEVSGKTIVLEPGQEQTFSFNFTGAGKDSVLYAKIEPVDADDAYWPDNEKTITVAANSSDLAIRITQQPSELRRGERVNYVARVTSKASAPITTTVRWDTPGNPFGPKTQTTTVPANGSTNVSFSFTMPQAEYGEEVLVVAQVNPNKNQPPNEQTWSNNRYEVVSIYIEEESGPPEDDLGPGILVP